MNNPSFIIRFGAITKCCNIATLISNFTLGFAGLITKASFGKKIADLCKETKMSQTDLAKKLSTSVSVISRYERDEMTPSIDVARNLAAILNTTGGYLLGESDQEKILKDPGMLKRLNDIEGMEPKEKSHVLFTLDALIQKIKLKIIAAL